MDDSDDGLTVACCSLAAGRVEILYFLGMAPQQLHTLVADTLKYKYMKNQYAVVSRTVVKLGASRQVVIPKKVHDRLGLAPGDYLDVEVRDGKVVLTPQELVEKHIRTRVLESVDRAKKERSSGPFTADIADEFLEQRREALARNRPR